MKSSTFNLMASLFIIGLMAGCGPSPTPQMIVVTATPAVTIEATLTPTPAPPPPPSATATPQETAASPTPTPPPVYPAGTLLKGSSDGVFYLTEAGARQHIYNWETFLAFGFSQKAIVAVDDRVLAALPLADELTRLLLDERGDLYWAAAGQLWLVNEWRHIVTQPDYPLPITQANAALLTSLSKRTGFANGILLHDKTQLYYFDQAAYMRSPGGVYAHLIPVAVSANNESIVIDVPPDVLAVYQSKTQLNQANINLAAQTQAANLRAEPTLAGQVLTTVQAADIITAYGWTANRDWLLVNAQGQYGWLASDVVEPVVALSLLPAGVRRETFTGEIPQPTAAAEKNSPPQPVLCYDTPIRGFGKVWGDHAEVQAGLNCPSGGEQGTAAAAQPFEHGLMLWLQADTSYSADPVYVLFDDGSYQRFGDLGPADPAKIGEIPAGFEPLGDKFSKVYWEGTGARVKERLGYATGPAGDTAGAYQQFYNGRMFWAELLKRIFVIYDYYRYDDQGNSTQIRAWAGYEDKF